jgi:hypothetical protein
MPSGERSQVWYPKVLELLRAGWRPELTWGAVIALRKRLQAELDDYRRRKGIVPPTFRCRKCGAVGQGSPPLISVRALLLALHRFGIEPVDRVRDREREWKHHRAEHGLDLYGQRTQASGSATMAPPAVGCPTHD